jgi:hypothetical protein
LEKDLRSRHLATSLPDPKSGNTAKLRPLGIPTEAA